MVSLNRTSINARLMMILLHFFGLNPEKGEYTEFLSTITDNPIVVREDQGEMSIMQTDSFLDLLTSSLWIWTTFYSPEYSITSNLKVEFSFGDSGISSSFSVQHFAALTGSKLTSFLVMQFLVLLCQILLLCDTFVLVKELRADKEEDGEWDSQLIFLLSLDFCIQVGSFIFFILNIWEKCQSGSITKKFIGRLVHLEWADKHKEFDTKKQEFLDNFRGLAGVINNSEISNVFGMCVALIIFLRMVLATDAHPRIALITNTLREAFSDMVHFFILFFMVLWGLALIASWRFGDKRSQFRDTFAAMRTQFDAVVSPPGELPFYTESDNDFEYLIFAIIVHVVNFFFLINFFLAIVVNAYTKVTEDLEACTVEQSIFEDFWAMIHKRILQFKSGSKWPKEARIVAFLEKATNESVITVDGLFPECFPTKESAESYFSYYSSFSFLVTQASKKEVTLEDVHSAQRLVDTKLNTVLGVLEGKATRSPSRINTARTSSSC